MNGVTILYLLMNYLQRVSPIFIISTWASTPLTERGLPILPKSDEEGAVFPSGKSSDPSSNLSLKDPEGSMDPISPNDDMWLCTEQTIGMAKALDVQVTTLVPNPKDKIVGRLYFESLGVISFFMLQGILDISNTLWEKPPIVPTISKRMENLYGVQQEGCPNLFIHHYLSLWKKCRLIADQMPLPVLLTKRDIKLMHQQKGIFLIDCQPQNCQLCSHDGWITTLFMGKDVSQYPSPSRGHLPASSSQRP